MIGNNNENTSPVLPEGAQTGEKSDERTGQEGFSALRERIDQGKISIVISRKCLLMGEPNKDVMYGRLEAYLYTGAVMDADDLMEIVERYGFTADEIKNLAKAAQIGIYEGAVQEPNNLPHLGERGECFADLSGKYIEMVTEKKK